MAKITGLGGVFLRAGDPKKLLDWYGEHLGLTHAHGSFLFPASEQKAKIAVTFFSRSADYFPVAQGVMLNFQVDDLHAVLAKLEVAGAVVDPKREQYVYGHFGWFTDPEGNRVELWEPAAS